MQLRTKVLNRLIRDRHCHCRWRRLVLITWYRGRPTRYLTCLCSSILEWHALERGSRFSSGCPNRNYCCGVGLLQGNIQPRCNYCEKTIHSQIVPRLVVDWLHRLESIISLCPYFCLIYWQRGSQSATLTRLNTFLKFQQDQLLIKDHASQNIGDLNVPAGHLQQTCKESR